MSGEAADLADFHVTVLPTSTLTFAALPFPTQSELCRAWTTAERMHKQSSAYNFLPDVLWVVYALQLVLVHLGS